MTSRSRAARAACSRAPASSCSTATSPSTTSAACGASGASSTPASPTSSRCRTARRSRPRSTRPSSSARRIQDGTDHHTANLADWIKPQLPPQGKRLDRPGRRGVGLPDRRRRRHAERPGHAVPRRARGQEQLARLHQRRRPQHRPRRRPPEPSCRATSSAGAEDRPKILFNPTNGRPAFPLLRPQLGKRPAVLAERPLGRAVPRRERRPGEDHAGRHARPVGEPQGRHVPGRRPPADLQHRRP